MDTKPDRPPIASFVPDRRYTGLAGAGALLALLAVLVTGDPSGRLLAGIAVLVLLAYVVCDLVFSPRLVVSADGVVIRSPLTRARLPWSDIETIRADTRSRLGLRATTLEIDAGTVFAVFSRRSLGADPEEVANLASAFRPR